MKKLFTRGLMKYISLFLIASLALCFTSCAYLKSLTGDAKIEAEIAGEKIDIEAKPDVPASPK